MKGELLFLYLRGLERVVYQLRCVEEEQGDARVMALDDLDHPVLEQVFLVHGIGRRETAGRLVCIPQVSGTIRDLTGRHSRRVVCGATPLILTPRPIAMRKIAQRGSETPPLRRMGRRGLAGVPLAYLVGDVPALVDEFLGDGGHVAGNTGLVDAPLCQGHLYVNRKPAGVEGRPDTPRGDGRE